MSDHGTERRQPQHIPDEIIEQIAERAAAKALEKVYADVGRSILHKLAWIIGAATVGVLIWMGGKGIPLK